MPFTPEPRDIFELVTWTQRSYQLNTIEVSNYAYRQILGWDGAKPVYMESEEFYSSGGKVEHVDYVKEQDLHHHFTFYMAEFYHSAFSVFRKSCAAKYMFLMTDEPLYITAEFFISPFVILQLKDEYIIKNNKLYHIGLKNSSYHLFTDKIANPLYPGAPYEGSLFTSLYDIGNKYLTDVTQAWTNNFSLKLDNILQMYDIKK